MRSVYHAQDLIDAQLVKDALEAAGIPAFVTGTALTGAMGELPMSGLIAVQVPDGAYREALPIAAQIDAWLRETPKQGWADDTDALPLPA